VADVQINSLLLTSSIAAGLVALEARVSMTDKRLKVIGDDGDRVLPFRERNFGTLTLQESKGLICMSNVSHVAKSIDMNYIPKLE
jgi:hypothetical protein